MAAQAGGILTYELVTGRGSGAHDPRIQLVNALLILALTLFAGKALLRTEPELLVRSEQSALPDQPAPKLSPSEVVLRDKLDAPMADRVYRTPGLTIAMDLGYNSLPTFNRAFRSAAGQTPTDYRRAAIGQN